MARGSHKIYVVSNELTVAIGPGSLAIEEPVTILSLLQSTVSLEVFLARNAT